MHPIVRLASETISACVHGNRTPEPPVALPSELPARAGAFVTIHAHGRLRGCIGTIEPTQDSLADEVIYNAVSAATRDPRFPPVAPEEVRGLEVKVDVLTAPEQIDGIDQLDPRRYGVIVQSKRSPWKRGLLLPDLAGVDTVERQVEIARQKARLASSEPVQLFRFSVRRYS